MRVGNQAALQELAERIAQADAVVIGGGSGLSSAAGYDHYHWSPALSEALAPFREQYGFTSPLAGFYHCFSSYGEQWGYYSQYIRFMWEAPTGQPYLDLQALVADKPAFVLTTNVDQQFFRVFPQKQICAFQGDFSYCQCSQPCQNDIWENCELVKELTAKNENVFYTCLNREASHRPEHLQGRSLYLQGDLAETLAALRQERSIAATIK